jgi:ubiquinone/menaquinone biosynthesis C-methylase UbiE
MDRSEWLKKMKRMNEELYDRFSPQYWVTFGLEANDTQREFLQKFLERIGRPGLVLSAGCGAGRHHGLLLEGGHHVVGIDQSAGMLEMAREYFPQEKFPQIRFERVPMQEMSFREVFDGVVCMDAMEHICPEDYPVVLRKFQEALKTGGVLYFTVDDTAWTENTLQAAYEHAKAQGLPVVFGELVDNVNESYLQLLEMDQVPREKLDVADSAVYHYYPSFQQVREWLSQAGMTIAEEGEGNGYHHFVAVKG